MNKKKAIEILNTIKVGEVWLSDDQNIRKIHKGSNGEVVFSLREGKFDGEHNLIGELNLDAEYYLEAQETYGFKEVFEEYKNGKIVQSLVSGNTFARRQGMDLVKPSFGLGVDISFLNSDEIWFKNKGFSLDEITGEWVIVE